MPLPSLTRIVAASSGRQPTRLIFTAPPDLGPHARCAAFVLAFRDGGAALALPLGSVDLQVALEAGSRGFSGPLGPSAQLEAPFLLPGGGSARGFFDVVDFTNEFLLSNLSRATARSATYELFRGGLEEDLFFDTQGDICPDPAAAHLAFVAWCGEQVAFGEEDPTGAPERLSAYETAQEEQEEGGAGGAAAATPARRRTARPQSAETEPPALQEELASLREQLASAQARLRQTTDGAARAGADSLLGAAGADQGAAPAGLAALLNGLRGRPADVEDPPLRPPGAAAGPDLTSAQPPPPWAPRPGIAAARAGAPAAPPVRPPPSPAPPLPGLEEVVVRALVASLAGNGAGALGSSQSAETSSSSSFVDSLVGLRGSGQRARLQRRRDRGEGLFSQTVLENMLREVGPSPETWGRPPDAQLPDPLVYLERYGAYGGQELLGQLAYVVSLTLRALWNQEYGYVADTLALLLVALEQAAMDGGDLMLGFLYLLVRDPTGEYLRRPQPQGPRVQEHPRLADPAWTTAILYYIQENDALGTRRRALLQPRRQPRDRRNGRGQERGQDAQEENADAQGGGRGARR